MAVVTELASLSLPLSSIMMSFFLDGSTFGGAAME